MGEVLPILCLAERPKHVPGVTRRGAELGGSRGAQNIHSLDGTKLNTIPSSVTPGDDLYSSIRYVTDTHFLHTIVGSIVVSGLPFFTLTLL